MAIASLTSRVTGFLRNSLLVAAIGVHGVGDAYNLANNLPNMVYELLLGGVLSSVLVPLLVHAQEDDPDGGVALLVRPTRKGRSHLERDRDVSREQIGKVLAGWSRDDVAEFGRLLRQFNNSIEHLEGRPWPR